MASPARALWIVLLCSGLAAASVRRCSAQQWQIGLGLNIAETDTNALGLGSTLTWNPSSWLFLRGYLDAEMGIADFREGLEYDEPADREYIIDTNMLYCPAGSR